MNNIQARYILSGKIEITTFETYFTKALIWKELTGNKFIFLQKKVKREILCTYLYTTHLKNKFLAGTEKERHLNEGKR